MLKHYFMFKILIFLRIRLQLAWVSYNWVFCRVPQHHNITPLDRYSTCTTPSSDSISSLLICCARFSPPPHACFNFECDSPLTRTGNDAFMEVWSSEITSSQYEEYYQDDILEDHQVHLKLLLQDLYLLNIWQNKCHSLCS